MKIFRVGLICTLLATAAFAQLTERNPVDELKEQVTKALADSKVPFSAEQEKQLTGNEFQNTLVQALVEAALRFRDYLDAEYGRTHQ